MLMRNLALRSPLAWDTDQWLRDLFGPATQEWFQPTTPRLRPAAEIIRQGDTAVVRLELPGIDVEKDVSVELDLKNGINHLVIQGEHRDSHTTEATEDACRTLQEIRYGSFRRSFQLPKHVTSEALTASYDAGMLTVRVADAYKNPDEPQSQRISITT